jgi:hypothetical protein
MISIAESFPERDMASLAVDKVEFDEIDPLGRRQVRSAEIPLQVQLRQECSQFKARQGCR